MSYRLVSFIVPYPLPSGNISTLFISCSGVDVSRDEGANTAQELMVSVQRICYANDAQLWLILFQGTPVLTVLRDVSVSKLKHLKLALVLSGGYPQQVPHRRQRHAFPSGIWVATSSAHRRCNPRCFVLLRHCGLHEVALLSIIFQGEPLSTSPPHTFSQYHITDMVKCRHSLFVFSDVKFLYSCMSGVIHARSLDSRPETLRDINSFIWWWQETKRLH